MVIDGFSGETINTFFFAQLTVGLGQLATNH